MTAPEAVAGLDFDPAALRTFLGSRGLTGALDVRRVGGGQSNPTYFVTVGDQEFVLRKRPAGVLAPSAHDVGREFRIMQALTGSGVPVPEMVLFCSDESVLGTPFYLMQRLYGRIYHDMSLRTAPAEERRSLYREQAVALAALHAVDHRGVGLGVLDRPGSFAARQIDRWERGWGQDRADDVAEVASWLRAHRPESERTALVHGDFKFSNIVFAPDKPELIGVLDWELAAIGEPMVDLGHIWSATWATTPQEYGGVLGLDLDAESLPGEDEWLEAYYAASRSDERLLPFHKVLGLFRNAGIFHGIGVRAADGTATAADAGRQGQTAHAYLDRALAIARGEAITNPTPLPAVHHKETP